MMETMDDSSPTPGTPPQPGPAVQDIFDLRLVPGEPAAGQASPGYLTLSWATWAPMVGAEVLLGPPEGEANRVISVASRLNQDQTTGHDRYVHKARLTRLRAGTRYTVLVSGTNVIPVSGIFQTALDAGDRWAWDEPLVTWTRRRPGLPAAR